jgi:hypothetical protein
MAKLGRLTVPSFDMAWLSITDCNGEKFDHLLIPGGGGSAKVGLFWLSPMYKVNNI